MPRSGKEPVPCCHERSWQVHGVQRWSAQVGRGGGLAARDDARVLEACGQQRNNCDQCESCKHCHRRPRHRPADVRGHPAEEEHNGHQHQELRRQEGFPVWACKRLPRVSCTAIQGMQIEHLATYVFAAATQLTFWCHAAWHMTPCKDVQPMPARCWPRLQDEKIGATST